MVDWYKKIKLSLRKPRHAVILASYPHGKIFNSTSQALKEPHHDKTCLLLPYANNKGADQPAHPHSLISAFVVRCLDSTYIICLVSISKIQSLYLASLAVQAGLCLTWSQTPEDRFSRDEAQRFLYFLQKTEHPCDLVCGRKLSCGLHHCDEPCHKGNCPPCLMASK